MTILTRRLAQTLKSFFRVGLNLSTRGRLPPVLIHTGDAGFRIRCRTAEATAEYCTTDQPLADQLVVPFDTLAGCAANNDQPLSLEPTPGGILARWQDGAVPQVKQFAAAGLPEDVWPELPERLAENPPQLLAALRDACQATDPGSTRFALGCLQLAGKGCITATDGRQLLVQRGFSFPWEGEILVPASKIFGCKHLLQCEPVSIGKTDQWLTIRVGCWTVQLKLQQDGRFPNIEDFLRTAGEATASVELPPADRDFLQQNLPRLPDSEDFNAPITLDLNGKVTVRAKAAEGDSITELVLARSTRSGDAICVNTNRRFLRRALDLGFDRLLFTSPSSPAYCKDERRTFLWALLEPTGALKPADDAVQINSAAVPEPAGPASPSTTHPRHNMKSRSHTYGDAQNPVSRSQAKSANEASSTAQQNGKHPEQQEATAIVQAVSLRDSLRSLAGEVGQLVRTLKRDKKQYRAVRSTLLTLKQLQAIDG